MRAGNNWRGTMNSGAQGRANTYGRTGAGNYGYGARGNLGRSQVGGGLNNGAGYSRNLGGGNTGQYNSYNNTRSPGGRLTGGGLNYGNQGKLNFLLMFSKNKQKKHSQWRSWRGQRRHVQFSYEQCTRVFQKQCWIHQPEF